MALDKEAKQEIIEEYNGMGVTQVHRKFKSRSSPLASLN